MPLFKKKSEENDNRCGNCGEYLDPKDKYCRYCGTQRGKGKFRPELNDREMVCVYGPPVKTVHQCSACGHRWVARTLGGDDPKYCPQCGSEAIKLIERDFEDF